MKLNETGGIHQPVGKTMQGVLLFVALFFCAGACFSAVNPYDAITTRNVFGIKPPVIAPPTPPPTPPPAELKLQGIVTLLGKKQVIIKTKPQTKPPEQPKDVSLMLSEGQREGEVEVVDIDEKGGIVRLRNGGNEVTLTLKNDSDKPVLSPVSAVAQPGIPAVNAPQAIPQPPNPAIPNPDPRSQMKTIPTRPTRPSPVGSSGAAVNPFVNTGTTAVPREKNGPTPETIMTPEEQTVIIEAHRQLHKNDPKYPPLPPTEITPNP